MTAARTSTVPLDRFGQLPEPPGPRWPVSVQTVLFGKYRHRLMPALRRRHGDVVMLRIAPHRRRLILLSRPEHIKEVFSGSSEVFHAGEGNAILGPIMGAQSVLLLDEADHLRMRQLLMPAFHGAALRGYRDLISEITRTQVASWPVGRPMSMHRHMQSLTLEVILKVVFGVTEADRLSRLRPVVGRVLELSPILMLGWFYPRLRSVPPWRGFSEIQRELDALLYAEIADRRLVTDLDARSDVLSRMLRTSRAAQVNDDVTPLTDTELRDNLVTLLLAGHETTATALAWAFYELAREPKLQRRAAQAAGRHEDTYLQAVAREAMRLHPVIYEVARRLTTDIELGGFRIRRGSTVMPAIGLVQADPNLHRDPATFDPERFLARQAAANTWIPFGGGIRRCLGAGFAELEATIVLEQVLSRFELAPGRRRPEHPRARNITLAPSAGARLVLHER
ncbi:cytochrome P450 [Jatrophihabitans telluris]|uniref:Cytochrome P450 n=1 Tax=Jatrophihabitans telluris TaxID=2038343 RepID=A0ABY4R1E7_9ACTN|nr:cytochrome P450 [Jatrophihabitans telluris]UQX89659.1 cytochrome P450 [Jatrophihabitans telluris]